MEITGLEPVTPRLAKAVLSQLSYIPKPGGIVSVNQMVGLDRFELSTSRLSGVRSDQLSYRPDKPIRFEMETKNYE